MKLIRPFFYRLLQNIGKIFSFRNLKWHMLAIVLTAICVTSGFDWFYFEHTRNATLHAILIPAALLGFIVPIITPVVFLALGRMRKSKELLNAGYALGQSAFLGWTVSSFYKALTGRIHPELFTSGANAFMDISRVFHFGFGQSGIFWGWPSSHTTVAFAVTATAIVLWPNRRTRVMAGAFALYVGIAVSATIHWFSDFLAGAIFGILIGIVVGLAYKDRTNS